MATPMKAADFFRSLRKGDGKPLLRWRPAHVEVDDEGELETIAGSWEVVRSGCSLEAFFDASFWAARRGMDGKPLEYEMLFKKD